MDGLLIVSAVLALTVTAAVWRLFHQLKRKQLLSGAMWGVQSLLLLCVFFVALLVYSNLHTYRRLTHEQAIADVYIRKLAPQHFQLSMSFSDADRDQHYYELTGDQWQLDARILKWKSWANLIGLEE